MKKVLFVLAVVAAAAVGVYKAIQTKELTQMSDLRLEDVEAEAQQTGDTFHAFRYGECVYNKCDQGGNFFAHSVWVTCTRTVEGGIGIVGGSISETEEILLTKCFYGGNSCREESCASYTFSTHD